MFSSSFVCLFVSRISRKLLDRFSHNLSKRLNFNGNHVIRQSWGDGIDVDVMPRGTVTFCGMTVRLHDYQFEFG